MKQMIRIVDKTYREYLTFYLKHERMPDEDETSTIYCNQFQLVLALAPNASSEDFEKLGQKRSSKYGERIHSEIIKGITLESFHKPKKTPEEKAAILKATNEARRKSGKKKKQQESKRMVSDQDDIFFFIEGYTSGGAPYGVVWEHMGMVGGD